MAPPSHATTTRAHGTGSLTQSVDNATCLDINGTWEAIDHNGDPVKFKVWWEDSTPQVTHVKALGRYAMALYEGDGTSSQRKCEYEDDDGHMQSTHFALRKDAEITLPGAWPCGTTSQTWTNIDATLLLRAMGVEDSNVSATMTVKLTLTSATQRSVDFYDIQVYYGCVGISWDRTMKFANVDSEDCYPIPIEMTQLVVGVCE